jgi:hypothetical protein
VGPMFITPETPAFWVFGLVFAHMGPFVCVLANFFLSNSRIKLSDCIIGFTITALYVLVNFVYTKFSGIPVYPFLTWNNRWTLLYCFFCWLFGYICMVLCSALQEWRLGRPFKNCL